MVKKLFFDSSKASIPIYFSISFLLFSFIVCFGFFFFIQSKINFECRKNRFKSVNTKLFILLEIFVLAK